MKHKNFLVPESTEHDIGGVPNPSYGGAHGYAHYMAAKGPDGKLFEAWKSGQPYIRNNVVSVMISAPEGLKYFNDAEKLIEIYKAFFETDSEAIAGITSTKTVEYNETPIGGGNQMQEDSTRTAIERSVPVHTVTDKVGRPYQKLLDLIIDYLISNGDQVAMVSKLPGYTQGTYYTESMAACTILYFEPDITWTRIEKAWLVSNMKPKGSGPKEGSKDKSAGREATKLEIEFTGITQEGKEIISMAQGILDKMNANVLNPADAPAFTNEAEADVAKSNVGYATPQG